MDDTEETAQRIVPVSLQIMIPHPILLQKNTMLYIPIRHFFMPICTLSPLQKVVAFLILPTPSPIDRSAAVLRNFCVLNAESVFPKEQNFSSMSGFTPGKGPFLARNVENALQKRGALSSTKNSMLGRGRTRAPCAANPLR